MARALFNMIRTKSSRGSMLFHEMAEIYKPGVFRQRDRVMDAIKDSAGRASNSELARKLNVAKEFWKLEMAPPSSADEIKRLNEDLILVKEFIKNNCWKYLTVKQAWLLILVGLEVSLWFFLGETIGKFHIVGYKV